jgi:hypothetical protein
MTKKEMFNVVREKILPIYREIIPSYYALEKAFDANLPIWEFPEPKIPSSLNNVVNKIVSLLCQDEPEGNIITEDEAIEHYEEYKRTWQLSLRARFGRPYDEWWYATKDLLEIYLPIFTTISAIFGIIYGLVEQDPTVFFLICTIVLSIDLFFYSNALVVKCYEEILHLWDVEMLLRVLWSINDTLKPASPWEIAVYACNINATQDALKNEKMIEDRFCGPCREKSLPCWTEAPENEEGWYRLSLVNILEEEPGRWCFPPGYWNISIEDRRDGELLDYIVEPLKKSSIYLNSSIVIE